MSEIGKVYIGKQAKSLDIAPQLDGYSHVVLNVSDELFYEAGASTGRTLTLFCPWGSQAMCNNILAAVRGYQYQPLDARSAIWDPAAELGDAVTVKDTYSMIGSIKTTFGPLLRADVAAPGEEEIDHEYPYKSPQERKITRQFANVEAKFIVQADLIRQEVKKLEQADSSILASLQLTASEIRSEVRQVQGNVDKANSRITQNANSISAEVTARESDIKKVNAQFVLQDGKISAKVSQTGGNDAGTFGWVLGPSSWIVHNGNPDDPILKAYPGGLEVRGKVTATSGRIGGFTIASDHLSYNSQTWGGANSTGIYIGPEGIQLGKDGEGFKVDRYGNIDAYNGKFRGTVNAGNVRYGGNFGYFDGYGLTGNTVTTAELRARDGDYRGITGSFVSGGINTSLGYANFANDVFNNEDTAGYVNATYGYFHLISMGGNLYAPQTYTFKDYNGNQITLRVLGRIYE